MKNKDVEDIVFEALNQYLNLEEKLQGEIVDTNLHNISKITREAFAAHRVQDATEIQIKNLERCLEIKDREIWEHKKAIENLRGYMGFLESQIEQYKFRLDEHEDSY